MTTIRFYSKLEFTKVMIIAASVGVATSLFPSNLYAAADANCSALWQLIKATDHNHSNTKVSSVRKLTPTWRAAQCDSEVPKGNLRLLCFAEGSEPGLNLILWVVSRDGELVLGTTGCE